LSFFFPCLFSPPPSSFLSLSFLSLSHSSFLLFSVFTFPSSLARLLSLSPRESSDTDVLERSDSFPTQIYYSTFSLHRHTSTFSLSFSLPI
jgi:hypothetical protein